MACLCSHTYICAVNMHAWPYMLLGVLLADDPDKNQLEEKNLLIYFFPVLVDVLSAEC